MVEERAGEEEDRKCREDGRLQHEEEEPVSQPVLELPNLCVRRFERVRLFGGGVVVREAGAEDFGGEEGGEEVDGEVGEGRVEGGDGREEGEGGKHGGREGGVGFGLGWVGNQTGFGFC